MRWFSKRYGSESYEPDLERFSSELVRLGAPDGMLMVSSGPRADTTVHIHLPERSAGILFPGFAPNDEPEWISAILVYGLECSDVLRMRTKLRLDWTRDEGRGLTLSPTGLGPGEVNPG